MTNPIFFLNNSENNSRLLETLNQKKREERGNISKIRRGRKGEKGGEEIRQEKMCGIMYPLRFLTIGIGIFCRRLQIN